MPRRQTQTHSAAEFDLDVMSGDTDMFLWFLLCYLFGKPIRSETAVATWRLFIEKKRDTPWAIMEASDRDLVRILHESGYTRYQHVTARGLKICMERLINFYDGSIFLMLESSKDEDEFNKRLLEFHGVGSKVAEIFMRETEEVFAQRTE
jgi:endonuclease III